jgi:hypothetical protein
MHSDMKNDFSSLNGVRLGRILRPTVLGVCLLVSSVTSAQNQVSSTQADTRTQGHMPENLLISLRDEQRTDQIRQHAWKVFASLTQTHSQSATATPIWDTWNTTRETFSATDPCHPASQGVRERTLQFPREILAEALAVSHHGPVEATLLPLITLFSDSGRSVLSEVLYNPAACRHIAEMRDLRDLRASLSQLKTPASELEIPPFPPDSIIVKASWRPIPTEGIDSFEVWDSPDPSKLNCSAGCVRTIKVKPSDDKCQLSAPVISTSCFYNIPVTKENIGLFSSSEWQVSVGDVWVLIGLHIITKEVPDWTWTTFWWHDDPDSGRFGVDKPPFVRREWRNYRMDTSLSMDTPWEEQSFKDDAFAGVDACGQTWRTPSKSKVIFNPYLEGAIKGALHMNYSNCVNCHSRSTFESTIGVEGGTPWRGYLSPTSSCFSDKMRLDYLWSLPHSSVDPSMKALLDALSAALDAKFHTKSQ